MLHQPLYHPVHRISPIDLPPHVNLTLYILDLYLTCKASLWNISFVMDLFELHIFKSSDSQLNLSQEWWVSITFSLCRLIKEYIPRSLSKFTKFSLVQFGTLFGKYISHTWLPCRFPHRPWNGLSTEALSVGCRVNISNIILTLLYTFSTNTWKSSYAHTYACLPRLISTSYIWIRI